MKLLITLTTLFLATSALAGGTGGGGVLAMTGQGTPITIPHGIGTIQSQWVKFKGMDRSEIVFEYGQQNHTGDLFTQEFRQRLEEFAPDQADVLKAIEASRANREWAKVN